MNTLSMISVPIAVNNHNFKMQLKLLWFNHQLTYGESLAREKLRAVIVKRNTIAEPRNDVCEWASDIPHVMAESCFDIREDLRKSDYLLPINIQLGLSQVLDGFDDERVIEVIDCDMFHLRPPPTLTIADDELIVTDIYEDWHLKSLTDHRDVIAPFFKNDGKYYNGGFVPIIGKVRTFKKILPAWIEAHEQIVEEQTDGDLQWWAGMYSLQAACENNAVWMRAMDVCYVPGINELQEEHYIAHYSVDHRFNKKTWPSIDISSFVDNEFYRRVLGWLRHERIVPEDTMLSHNQGSPDRENL
jgi:hypothetical protein